MNTCIFQYGHISEAAEEQCMCVCVRLLLFNAIYKRGVSWLARLTYKMDKLRAGR